MGDVCETEAARPFESSAMPHRQLQPWNPVAVHLAEDLRGQGAQTRVEGRALDGGVGLCGPSGEWEHFLHEEALQPLRLVSIQVVGRPFEPEETLATRRIEAREILLDQRRRRLL